MSRSEDSSSKVADLPVAADVDWLPRICLVKSFYKSN